MSQGPDLGLCWWHVRSGRVSGFVPQPSKWQELEVHDSDMSFILGPVPRSEQIGMCCTPVPPDLGHFGASKISVPANSL